MQSTVEIETKWPTSVSGEIELTLVGGLTPKVNGWLEREDQVMVWLLAGWQ